MLRVTFIILWCKQTSHWSERLAQTRNLRPPLAPRRDVTDEDNSQQLYFKSQLQTDCIVRHENGYANTRVRRDTSKTAESNQTAAI